MFAGLRGVGKTVLLGELAGAAMGREWIVVQVEARATDFGTLLAAELAAAVRRRKSWLSNASSKAREALGSITSFQASVGSPGVSLGIERLPGSADSGVLQVDLVDLAETVGSAAIEDGIGVVLFIDEMQDLNQSQLSALCKSCHRAGQAGLPWFVVGAGLPNLPTQLAEAESYSERLFDYRRVDRLADEDASVALLKPAQKQGVSWADDAADFVVSESGGYPYFIQQFGKNVWDEAGGPDTISMDDALHGVTVGQQKLDIGFYSSRWERATKTERKFLIAMAEDDGRPSKTSVIVERLGKKRQSDVGPARAKLISKGIVYSPEHGMITYTVPGMADYVKRLRAQQS